MPSKADKYPLINDYTQSSSEKGTEISVNPYWIVLIVRLGLPITFSRQNFKSYSNFDLTEGGKIRGDHIVITSDCIDLAVNNEKGSHTKSLSAVLKRTNFDYLKEILPGDWVVAWMVNDEKSFNGLLDRLKKIKATDPCNKFNDGFKFLGRVQDIGKTINQDKATGNRSVSYTLSATAFSELDSHIFYDLYLASASDVDGSIANWLGKLGKNINEMASIASKTIQTVNNINVLIPTALDLIIGKGIQGSEIQASKAKNINPAAGGGATSGNSDAAFAYIIPTAIGEVLGIPVEDSSKKVMSYADVLTLLSGVQNYPNESDTVTFPKGINTETDDTRTYNIGPSSIFIPKLDQSKTTFNRMVTKQELSGSFYAIGQEFVNSPLWEILRQWLNPSVNEMYTCMRVNRQENIMPTIVLRQIPFTTEAFKDKLEANIGDEKISKNIPNTKFLNLPRWQLDSSMVSYVDVNRSNATRFNFVHFYGKEQTLLRNFSVQTQIAYNPPIRDDLDIQRSGLKPYMGMVDCRVDDNISSSDNSVSGAASGLNPTIWMRLIADRAIGSQYTLNGMISSIGIQSPICEGDNLEWDGVIFHIEGVHHRCSINQQGNKTFTTTLKLVNGMDSLPDDAEDTSNPKYPGIDASSLLTFEPGISFDNIDKIRTSTSEPEDFPQEKPVSSQSGKK